MDNSKTITHLSLCTGYGGIDLGLKRAVQNVRTIAYSEIEAFACSNLVEKMEKGFLDVAPIWTDTKTFPWQEFSGQVDILSGGYPCQPFSTAGKRKGEEDPRHLWPHIANGISIIKPKLCFFENVEGHINFGLSEVIQELERIGYSTAWGIYSASEIGSPHKRKRVYILASDRTFSGTVRKYSNNTNKWPAFPEEEQYGWEPKRTLGDPESERCQEPRKKSRYSSWPSDWRKEQGFKSEMGGNTNGNPGGLDHAELYQSCNSRTDELRLLGNGVIPGVAEKAFIDLFEIIHQ